MDFHDNLAIFQLLEDDLRAISLAQEAERVQLADILTATMPVAESRSPLAASLPDEPLSDIHVALSIFALDNQIARDQAYAELLRSQDASLAVNRQYAQRLAAAEQKTRIDGEFAKKLQDMLDLGESEHEIHDVDK